MTGLKENAKERGIDIRNGSIAEFLANEQVENYFLSKLRQ
jgi:hypothetical protein